MVSAPSRYAVTLMFSALRCVAGIIAPNPWFAHLVSKAPHGKLGAYSQDDDVDVCSMASRR